jgi:flagellar motor switch protein FliG
LADDKLKEKVFNNMSERAREILKEEMGYLGPVRIRQVEDAQQKILETLRRLQFVGEVVIPMRGVEEKFV